MTSQDIHQALQTQLFGAPRFCYLKEFRAGTGYAPGSERYLDAWAIETKPSSPMCRVAIEIKVSRGDFKRELDQPWKRDSALRLCNEFYFAAPLGLIQPFEVPEECGLIEVDPAKWNEWTTKQVLTALHGMVTITTQAPHRENLPTWPFVASLARVVADYQAKEKHHGTDNRE